MEQKQKDNGAEAKETPCAEASCDRYPDRCPLVESVKRVKIKVEGSVGSSGSFIDCPEEIWAAVAELERDFENLSHRIDEVSTQVLKDKRVTTISFTERTWRSPFMLVIFFLVILFFIWLAVFPDHRPVLNRSRGDINSIQTKSGD